MSVPTPRRLLLVGVWAGLGAMLTPVLFGSLVEAGGTAESWIMRTYPPPWALEGVIAYLLGPVAALGCIVAYILPGLAMTRRSSGHDVLEWVLHGFTASLLIWAAFMQILALAGFGENGTLVGLVALISALGSVLIISGPTTRKSAEPPKDDSLSGPFIVLSGAALLLLMGAFGPKLHWEPLNGDGAHAFESIRMFVSSGSPFWSVEAGDISGFPGVTSVLFVYPGAFFMGLIGPVEAAARITAFLYLLPAAAGVLLVARRAGARLTAGKVAVTWAGVSLYLVVLGFSASYNPFTADLALPATQDTLLLVTFLGFVAAFLDEAPRWMILYVVLCTLGLPNGPLLVALWAGAVLVAVRPIRWKPLGWTVVAVGVALATVALLPFAAELIGAAPPGDEYAGAGLMDRLRNPIVGHFPRFLYWVVPCGIVPACALVLWRGHSAVGRATTLVIAGYFAFFYIQPKTALHYYAPLMLLPWIVLWSNRVFAGEVRRMGRALLALGLSGALAWSLPWGYRLDWTALEVGHAIDDYREGYATAEPAVFAASELLQEVVPLDWDDAVPAESYGGSPLTWLRYANRDGDVGSGALRLLPINETAPRGGRLLSRGGGAALYVLDEPAWRALRLLRPPNLVGAPIYRVPKSMLF